MKQTAVEWLASQVIVFSTQEVLKTNIEKLLEEAKEIEKKQLRECYHFSQIEQQKEFSSIYVGMSFEKWYNEIYKNE